MRSTNAPGHARRDSRRLHQLSRGMRGQALVFFALVSLVLFGMLGLALDGGYNFAQRRAMQNAADAAALAGAKALQGNNAPGFEVWPTVQEVAKQNGVGNPDDPTQLYCVFLRNDLTVVSKSAIPSDDNAQDNTALECKDRKKPFPAGANVSAVRVRVSESHTTFVMRALGTTSSGTAATATAQIQAASKLSNALAPFIACGTGSKRVNASGNQDSATIPPLSIFKEVVGADPDLYTYNSSLAKLPTYQAPVHNTGGVVQFNLAAYSYDWDGDKVNGVDPNRPWNVDTNTFVAPAGPNPYRYLIHDNSGYPLEPSDPAYDPDKAMERCTAGSSFFGYNGSKLGYINITKNLYLQDPTNPSTGGGYVYPQTPPPGVDCETWLEVCAPAPNATGPRTNNVTVVDDKGIATGTRGIAIGKGDLAISGTGTRSGPASTVPGPYGCPKDKAHNCMLILPVVDDSVVSPSGSNSVLAVRQFAAFWMQDSCDGKCKTPNQHYGYLVKDYPINLEGSPTWTPGYTGTVTIRLQLVD